MKGRRISAGLGAAWMLLLLATPAAAKRVNATEDPDKLYDIEYGEDYFSNVGNIENENEYWSTQPFHSYWTDSGHRELSSPKFGKSRLHAIMDAYYSGKGGINQKALDGVYGYMGLQTIMTGAVYSEEADWHLEKAQETTTDNTEEVIYVGEVMTGDTIFVQANSYLAGTAYAQFKGNAYYLPLNDPEYNHEWDIEPNEYWGFYSNIRAVQRNGKWIDGADDYDWSNNAGHVYCAGWLYTVEEGDEVIYADAMAKIHYNNHYTGEEKDITLLRRFKFVVMDSGADVTLPLDSNPTGTQESGGGTGGDDWLTGEDDDGDNWWDTLFGGDDEDTGSDGYYRRYILLFASFFTWF